MGKTKEVLNILYQTPFKTKGGLIIFYKNYLLSAPNKGREKMKTKLFKETNEKTREDLIRYMRDNKITQSRLSQEIEVSQPFLSAFIAGKDSNNLTFILNMQEYLSKVI